MLIGRMSVVKVFTPELPYSAAQAMVSSSSPPCRSGKKHGPASEMVSMLFLKLISLKRDVEMDAFFLQVIRGKTHE